MANRHTTDIVTRDNVRTVIASLEDARELLVILIDRTKGDDCDVCPRWLDEAHMKMIEVRRLLETVRDHRP